MISQIAILYCGKYIVTLCKMHCTLYVIVGSHLIQSQLCSHPLVANIVSKMESISDEKGNV